MIATDSLTPLSVEELQEAEQLSQSDRPDAALFAELETPDYEALATAIRDAPGAIATCREIALTQGKVLAFQRDCLLEQIRRETDAGE